VSGVFVLLGIAATVREFAFEPAEQGEWTFYRVWTLDWPWWLWAIALLAALLVILSGGAYSAVQRREKQLERSRPHLVLGFDGITGAPHPLDNFASEAFSPFYIEPARKFSAFSAKTRGKYRQRSNE
jgi:hypothetical protein